MTLTGSVDKKVTIATGASLWCQDSGGSGEAIILLHAYSGNYLSWACQIKPLTAAGFRVISYSRRGYYGSDPLAPDCTVAQGEDLVAILDACGVDRAHVVGVAAGGSTALDAMLHHPERLLSCTVVSSLMSLSDAAFKARLGFLREAWFHALPHEVQELGASFRMFEPDAVAEWKRVQALNPKMEMPKDTRMIHQPLGGDITLAGLAASDVPLCLMTGAADLYMPPRLLREVASHLPKAKVEIFTDAGHAPHIETPDLFNAALLQFIQGR